MARFIDPFRVNNLVDANILDDAADGQDAAVREIVRLAETRQITLLLPYSVRNELSDPNTPAHVRRAADQFLFSIEVELTNEERARIERVITAAKGDADEKNIRTDLFHICEAAKYGGYFITRDKRLLKRRSIVQSMLQVDLVTPSEFLERVQLARGRAVSSD
jgi:predicted nucleic acid-binding protein